MQVGMIGLGRMGGNMLIRLMRGGHEGFAYDRDPRRTAEFDTAEHSRALKAGSLAELIDKLKRPRVAWLMLPAGPITEAAVNELAVLMQPDDTIIDGGNTLFKDDIRRATELKKKNLHYIDVGTSGGVWGLERGYCMMIGGPADVVKRLDSIFATLAPGTNSPPSAATGTARLGYIHCGPAGSGHFVKMVHNGIEYGLMQAYAEGFEILQQANSAKLPEHERFDLNLHDVAEVWRHGSVVSSWLLDLLEISLQTDPGLAAYSGYVQDSGEGRWTLQAAMDEDVPAPVLAASLFTRFRSRMEQPFAEKVLSAMRMGFGGHKETRPSGG